VRLRGSEIASATGGRLIGPDVVVDGAAIDSRLVRGGELFVPIVAERDGHDFIPAARAAGAAATLSSRRGVLGDEGVAVVEVAETAEALLALGRVARRRIPDRVVGITGSVGKTTTKDLLRAVLATTFDTAASERSFNNELGVPLTLLNLSDGVEATVVEMGARGPGHIALLAELARPTVAVVTAVVAAHLERFGRIEAVADAKAELVEALPADGLAALNADDPLVAAMATRTRARVLTYGEHGGDVRAEAISVDDELRPRFRIRSEWGGLDVRLAARGRHQVGNALAAVTVGLALGVTPEAVAGGLAAAELSSMRMELVRTPAGATVLNDAYNANPTSMRAALEALAAVAADRRVAILGVMAELGAGSDGEHAAVAGRAAELGLRVISVDAPAYGIAGPDAVADVDAALSRLGALGPGDAVLVKASRVAALERVVQALVTGVGVSAPRRSE
jgi:UDP-N-acetylmuramoyl-tripeptide--D-alanyl-D-alanine ligase